MYKSYTIIIIQKPETWQMPTILKFLLAPNAFQKLQFQVQSIFFAIISAAKNYLLVKNFSFSLLLIEVLKLNLQHVKIQFSQMADKQ